MEDVDGTLHLNGEFQESVRLVRIGKTVTFHSSRTEMEFSRLDGRLDLDSGDLRADSLTGPMRLTTRSKDISLEGLSGDLRLEDETGRCQWGCTSRGISRSKTARATCRLRFRRIRRFQVEARAHPGEIESDFDEFKIDNCGTSRQAPRFDWNERAAAGVERDKGTIEIRKGTVAVVAPASRRFRPPRRRNRASPRRRCRLRRLSRWKARIRGYNPATNEPDPWHQTWAVRNCLASRRGRHGRGLSRP
jgi:hypothetical protein